MTDIELDPADVRYRGYCRSCKKIKNDVLADNGYCGDCD